MALDIQKDPEFYRREWIVQQVGWMCMLLLTLVGVAGVSVREGALRVHYDRIIRHSAPWTFDVLLILIIAVIEENGGISIIPKKWRTTGG